MRSCLETKEFFNGYQKTVTRVFEYAERNSEVKSTKKTVLDTVCVDQHCMFLGTGWLSKSYKLNVQTGQVLLEEINSNFFFTRPDSY